MMIIIVKMRRRDFVMLVIFCLNCRDNISSFRFLIPMILLRETQTARTVTERDEIYIIKIFKKTLHQCCYFYYTPPIQKI